MMYIAQATDYPWAQFVQLSLSPPFRLNDWIVANRQFPYVSYSSALNRKSWLK